MDRIPDGPGFVILRAASEVPREAKPLANTTATHVRALNAPSMRTVCENEGQGKGLDWVIQCGVEGRIVTQGRVDELDKWPGSPLPEDRSLWGHLERVDPNGLCADVPVIRRTTYVSEEEFWAIPSDVVFQPPEPMIRPHANVRYTKRVVSKKKNKARKKKENKNAVRKKRKQLSFLMRQRTAFVDLKKGRKDHTQHQH